VNLFYVSNPAPGYLDEHGCVKAQNEMAIEFNSKLKERIVRLKAELPEAAITYVDVYSAKYGLISNAKNLGNCQHHFLTRLDTAHQANLLSRFTINAVRTSICRIR
jgi:hypothetical protein